MVDEATMVRCPRCNGTGWIPKYQHIQGGICFLCLGSGQARHDAVESWSKTDEGRNYDPEKALTDAALMNFGRTYGMATYDLLFVLSEQSAERYHRAVQSLREGRHGVVAAALRQEFGKPGVDYSAGGDG